MADDKNKGGGSGDLEGSSNKKEVKGTGFFGKIDDGVTKIKDGFSKGGFIDKVVKVAKVAGLATLAIGGLVASEKLKEAGTIASLGEVLDDIKNGEGIAKLMNPAEKAKEEEPIKIPEKSEIEKPKPEGDKQAKKDKRKAKAEKVTGTIPTRVALENAAKMNQLSKRTKNIMESYGLKSAKPVDMIELTPNKSPSTSQIISPIDKVTEVGNKLAEGPQQVTTQDIVTSYQLHGGRFESLLAANNELLGIISEEVELIHTNMVTSLVAKNARSKLMEILADKDDKVAEKIQEQNSKIETVSDKMLKNMAEAKNKTNENLTDGEQPKVGSVKGDKSNALTKFGEMLGTITKLAIPFLAAKSVDILTEDSDKERQKNDSELNKKKLYKNDGSKVDGFVTETTNVFDKIGDFCKGYVEFVTGAFNSVIDSFLGDDSTIGKGLKWLFDKFTNWSGPGLLGKIASGIFGGGGEKVTDEDGNVHQVKMKTEEDLKNDGYVVANDKNGNKRPISDGKFWKLDPNGDYVRKVIGEDENGNKKYGEPVTYTYTNGSYTEVENEGPGGGSTTSPSRPKPSKPSSSSRPSVRSNVRGAGKQISIDTNKNFTGFNGGGSNKGPDKGVSYEAGGNTPWNAEDAKADLANYPDMDPEAATAANNAVQAMKDLEAKVVYSQTGGRDPYGGDGTSDCSSTVRHVLMRNAGVDPGYNTVSQIMNKEGVWVDRSTIQVDGSGEGKVPDESKLRPGDLLFFRPNNPARRDKSRPYQVGHVEMYVGNGQMMGQTGEAPGHKGPVYHPLTKQWLVNGYIGAKRFILNKTNPVNSVDDAVGNYMKENGILNQNTGQIESGAQLDSAVENFKKSMNSNPPATELQNFVSKVSSYAHKAKDKVYSGIATIADATGLSKVAGSIQNTLASAIKSGAQQPQQPIIIPQQGSGGGNTVVNNDSHDTYYITNDGSSNSDIRRK